MGMLGNIFGGLMGGSGGGGQQAGAEKKLEEAKKYQLDWGSKLAGVSDPLMNYGAQNYGNTMTGAGGAAGQVGNYAQQMGGQRLQRSNPALAGAYGAQQGLAKWQGNPAMMQYQKAAQGVGNIGPMRGAYELAKQDADARMAREGTTGTGIQSATMRGLAGDYENNVARAAIEANKAKADALSGVAGMGLGAQQAASNAAQGLSGIEDTWARASNDATLQALAGAMGGYGQQSGLYGQQAGQMSDSLLGAAGLNQNLNNAMVQNLQALGGMKANRGKDQMGYAGMTGQGLGDLGGGILSLLLGGGG